MYFFYVLRALVGTYVYFFCFFEKIIHIIGLHIISNKIILQKYIWKLQNSFLFSKTIFIANYPISGFIQEVPVR